MADIRNIIAFAQNEQLIREFFAFKMYFPVKAKINLSVTNKRLIVYSNTQSMLNFEQEALLQQINIDDIRGLELISSKRYNYSILIFGGILFILGSVLCSLNSNMVFNSLSLFGTILNLGGLVTILLCFLFPKKVFMMQIKGVTQNLNVGGLIDIKPVISVGPDIQKIVTELGALIIEIQEGTIYERK